MAAKSTRSHLLFVGVFSSLVASLVAMSSLVAQEEFSEWSFPENLGSVVNSSSNDRFPAISPDGLSLYFQSNRPGGLGADDFWFSRRDSPDHPWGPPANLGPPINTSSDERAPNFSSDGRFLYFVSDRPGGCGGRDIWISWRRHRRDDKGWSAPRNLDALHGHPDRPLRCRVNTAAEDSGPAYFEDTKTRGRRRIITLFLHSNRPGGVGGDDLYASLLRHDDSFGSPALVWELATPTLPPEPPRVPGSESRPAIRLDGLEVFFHSDRPPGEPGTNRDLWFSMRETSRDAWSTPMSLGPTINSPSNELGPALSADATALYFSSTNRPDGFGGEDLYVSTRVKLEKTGQP